jgi:hypothetical protein
MFVLFASAAAAIARWIAHAAVEPLAYRSLIP